LNAFGIDSEDLIIAESGMAVLIRNLLINAQRFRLIAGQTRRIPCHFHSLQLSFQRTQLKADLNQDHLDSLQVRVGEIIGNARQISKRSV